MDYIGLLRKIVDESGLTHAEITRRCEEAGVWFNDNYISTIKNRKSIPRVHISRAIAKACGRHEDLLVIQAYYDKSPKAFKDIFDSIIKIVMTIILMVTQSKLDSGAIGLAQKKLDEMAFAEWLEYDLSGIAGRVDIFLGRIKQIFGIAETLNIPDIFDEEIEDICSYIMADDSMSPTIPKDATVDTKLVTLQSLKAGDYIRYSADDNAEACIRKMEFMGDTKDTMLLIPVNGNGYKTELVKTSDSRMYEKVVQVVINFE